VNPYGRRSITFAINDGKPSRDTVERTAHRFTGAHFVTVLEEGSALFVTLTARADSAVVSVSDEEFRTALLDETLRARVLAETRDIRDTLVRAAFSGARPGNARATDKP